MDQDPTQTQAAGSPVRRRDAGLRSVRGVTAGVVVLSLAGAGILAFEVGQAAARDTAAPVAPSSGSTPSDDGAGTSAQDQGGDSLQPPTTDPGQNQQGQGGWQPPVTAGS